MPEEKISLRKLGDTNLTKEQLRNQLFELLNEKRDLDEKVNIAHEYTKTVEYMITGEKKKLLRMQEETNQIQEKLNNYHKYDNLINENLQKTKQKNNNFSDLSHKLMNNIDLANNIINDNNEKNKILENRILNKENITWRQTAGNRPWLAGIVKKEMCALLHVKALIKMFENGVNLKDLDVQMSA